MNRQDAKVAKDGKSLGQIRRLIAERLPTL